MHLVREFAIAIVFVGVVSADRPHHPRHEVPTTEPPQQNYNEFCRHMLDGNHADWAHDSCARYFISCNHGHGWLQDCPRGLYYDPLVGQCLNKFQPILSCCEPRDRNAETPPKFSVRYFNCEHRRNGDYADPNYQCASHYFTCDHGNGIVRYCPGGLYLHPEKRSCVPTRLIDDCRPRPTSCD